MSATNSKQRPWYSDVNFWSDISPILFTESVIRQAEQDVNDIVKLLALAPGARVLDLACGIGRHSLHLAKKGYRVTGVDQARAFLDQAQHHASAAGVTPEFVCQDIREFRRPRAFDVALILWNTFGYFEDRSADLNLLKQVHESLHDGGKILIQTVGKEHLARRMRRGGRDWFEKGEYLELIERRVSKDWSREETRLICISGTTRREFNFSMRVYSGVELYELLKEAGFCKSQLYSSLQGDDYNSWTGEPTTYLGDLVVVADR